MKKKNKVEPPSKHENLPVSQEQAIEIAKQNYLELIEQANKAKDEYIGQRDFEKTAFRASKVFSENKDEIKQTFKDNKGELVKKFNKRNEHLTEAKISGFMSAISGLGSFTIFAFGDFYPLAAVMGVAAGMAAWITGEEIINKKKVDQQIKSRIEQHKATGQLPAPK